MSSSTSTTPRIVRGKPPKRTFTEYTYKKAKPFLMRDFQRRCAYSQQHTDRSLGERTMEVDHFNPTLVGAARNRYPNLFLGTRHCNASKSNIWPTKKDRKLGIRLLNPCKEMDYGVHVFEHPITHRLIGVTPSGDFHITACDLNATHLVSERTQRAAIHDLLFGTPVLIKREGSLLPADLLFQQFEKMIPMIPYLSNDHPKYHEEIKLMEILKRAPERGEISLSAVR